MFVIHARNVNDAYVHGMSYMATHGLITPSRNGPVRRVPYPVATVYASPQERVLFTAQRDANPFFHLFEALWMVNGQNDVATLRQFNRTFGQFSDDGITFHGAYGYRWRHWGARPLPPDVIHPLGQSVGMDQLAKIITMLQRDPSSRRAVIGMWDPARDLDTTSGDIPCNDLIKLSIHLNHLNMQVYNRSNDIVWGCYGANAVHMSFLQEYLASMIGVPMGTYTQISGDYHAYIETPYRWSKYYPLTDTRDPYNSGITTYPLVHAPAVFDNELAKVMSFVADGSLADRTLCDYQNFFFSYVVRPMYRAHRCYRNGDFHLALAVLSEAKGVSTHNDWLTAGTAWLLRRAELRSAHVSA